MSKFTTIKVFEYPHEAQIIRNKLESEGIYVFLKDELTIQTDNFLSNAIGGVKLQVKTKDIKRAKEIVALFKKEPLQKIKELVLKEDESVACPNCNSIDIRVSKEIKGIVGVLLLFFGLPLPIYKKEYHCFDCYKNFKVSFTK